MIDNIRFTQGGESYVYQSLSCLLVAGLVVDKDEADDAEAGANLVILVDKDEGEGDQQEANRRMARALGALFSILRGTPSGRWVLAQAVVESEHRRYDKTELF